MQAEIQSLFVDTGRCVCYACDKTELHEPMLQTGLVSSHPLGVTSP